MPYKTMNEIALMLKDYIDDYWKLKISEQDLRKRISDVFSITDNRGLIMRGFSFKAGFERILGKKRMDVIIKELILIDKDLYKGLIK